MAIPNPYGSLGTIWSEIGLDYSKLDQGAAVVAQKTTALDQVTQAAVKKMSQEWQRYGEILPGAVAAPLSEIATQTIHTSTQVEQSLDRTTTAAQSAGAELGNLSSKAQQLGSNYGRSADQVVQKTDEVERKTKSAVDNMSRDWQRYGTVLSVSVTAPLTLIATQFTRTYAGFEQSMARTAAVAQATDAELAQLTATARDLGATTQYTARQAADGMTFLAMAGFEANEVIGAMPGVLELAAVAQLDLATAADITTNILTGYGFAVEELARVNDVLTAAMTSANTNLQQLGEAMKYAGPIATAAGIQFEEAAAAIALMGNAGIQGCYDGQTDVLVKRGWVRWHEVRDGDVFATVNPETHEIEWQKPIRLIAYRHTGRMYRVRNRSLSLLVTPDHRMWVQRRGATRYSDPKAEEIVGKAVRYRTGDLKWRGQDLKTFVLPGFSQNRGVWQKEVPPTEIDAIVWATFLGWYVTEGSCDHLDGNYRIRITQNSGTVRDRMRKVLSELPWTVSEDKNGFTIHSEQLYRYVEPLGTVLNKRLPDEALEWSPKLLRVLHDAMIEGDGDENGALYTASEALRDQFITVVIKLGWSATYSIDSEPGSQSVIRGRVVTSENYCWKVNVQKRNHRPWHDPYATRGVHGRRRTEQIAKSQEGWVPFDGMVYCAEVPNSLLIVRRDGKVVVSGNSMAGTSLRNSISRLLNPTGEARRILRDLGIEATDSSGRLKTLTEIVTELERSGASAGDMLILFGQRAGPAMQALVDQGSASLAEFTTRLEESGGIAQRIAEQQMDTLQGAFLRAKSAGDELGISLVNVVLPALRSTVETVANVLRWMADLPPSVHAGAIAFGALAAAAGPVILAGRAIVAAWGPLTGPYGLLAMLVMGLTSLGFGLVTAAREKDKLIEKNIETAKSMRDEISELDRLINRYEDLNGKPDKSAQEHTELRNIIDQIVKLAPQAVIGYDDMGNALLGNADAAKRFRDEMKETLQMLLEVTAREADIRLPFLEGELEESLRKLHKANDDAQKARQDYEAALAGGETIGMASYKAMYDFYQAEAAEVAQQVRKTIEDINRLKTAQEQLKALMSGETEPAPSNQVDAVTAITDEVKRLTDEQVEAEIKVWQMRIAAAGQGTAEQRQIMGDFFAWLNDRLAEDRSLEITADMRPMRDSLGQLLEEMRAIDEVAEIRQKLFGRDDPSTVTGIKAAQELRLEVLKLQQAELELAAGWVERAGFVGEKALRVFQDASKEVGREIELIQREMSQAQITAEREVRAEIDANARARRDAVAQMQRESEAAFRRQAQLLNLEVQIRSIVEDPMPPEEELERTRDLLEQIQDAARIKVELDYETPTGHAVSTLAEQVSLDFAESFGIQLRDQIALLEAELRRPAKAKLIVPDPTEAQQILDAYNKGLAEIEARFEVTNNGMDAIRARASLITNTLVDWRVKGLDPADERVAGLQQQLEFLKRVIEGMPEPVHTIFPVAEPEYDVEARIQKMRDDLEEARRLWAVFGDEFNMQGEAIKLVRGTIQDLIGAGLDPADDRIRKLVALMDTWKVSTSDTHAVLQDLESELAINVRRSMALGDSFDRNRADAQAYSRALDRLAMISLTATGEELENVLALMDDFGERIRRLGKDTDGLDRVAKGLGGSLLHTVTNTRSLGSYMTELFETVEEQGISFGEAFKLSMSGVAMNTASIVGMTIDGILDMISATRRAYDRLDERAAESRKKANDSRSDFMRLVRAGFEGEFVTIDRWITEKVEGGFFTGLGQWLGIVPREVGKTIQEVSEDTVAWIERMEHLLEDLRQAGRTAMQDAFRTAPGHEMPFFMRSLRQGVYDSVTAGLIDAFTESRYFTQIMAPLWQAMDQAMEESFKDGSFNSDRWWQIFGPELDRFQGRLGEFEGPLAEMRKVLAQLQQELGLPFVPDQAATGGNRLTQFTGEQRDLFTELLRPVRIMDRIPGYHDAHMMRLDRIIEIMERTDGVDLSGDIQRFVQSERAVFHAGQITVEHISSATFTGPIGTIKMVAGEDDLRDAIRKVLDDDEAAGLAATR